MKQVAAIFTILLCFFCLTACQSENAVESISIDANTKEILDSLGEDERKGDFEAGISLETGQVRGDHRDLFHAGFFQSAPDEADVVGGTAATARLGHDDCSAV